MNTASDSGQSDATETISRLLVVMPTWLGDCVMATPALRAIRAAHPQAHIAVLVKRNLRSILEGCPWIDRILTVRPKQKSKGDDKPKKHNKKGQRGWRLARRLAAGNFDTAILLPNSFRSALMVRMSGIKRRIGYDRDGRGGLLTDRLLARRTAEGYVPMPTIDYYLGLASYVGAEHPSRKMELFSRPQHDNKARELLSQFGIDAKTDEKRVPFVLLNPGCNFGAAKRWFSERFAAVGDMCVEKYGAKVAVSGAPNERPILDAVVKAAKHPVIDLPSLGIDLATLKSVIGQADVMVTNDTGPRHIAAAMGVPVVTAFGPTDPVWSEIDFVDERQVYVDVYCRPCQKKKCPLVGTDDDHQCMHKLTAEMVFEQVDDLLQSVAKAGPVE